MEDNFRVTLYDVANETEYVTICKGVNELGRLCSNLDEENYYIDSIENIGCMYQEKQH